MSLAKAAENARRKVGQKTPQTSPIDDPLAIALEDFESATTQEQKVEALKAFIELSKD